MKYHKRFSKSEVRGMLMLLFIICGICIVHFLDQQEALPLDTTTPPDSEVIALQEFVSETGRQVKSLGNDGTDAATLAATPFDPNSATLLEMTRAGLQSWQAQNVIKYRQKGGVWKSKAHFQQLYGLSAEQYERIAPLLLLPENHETKHIEERGNATAEAPRRIYQKQEKFSAGTTLDINTADTTLLKHIPGIGSYYAQKICRYRDRLGGFVSAQQMDEIEGLPSDIKDWITVSPHFAPERVYINRATFKELIHHPYLNYEQTKAIVNYRSKYGAIRSFDALSLDTNFTEGDFRRLQPYIDFSK